MPAKGCCILDQPQSRCGVVQRGASDKAVRRQRSIKLPGQFAEAYRRDASAVRQRHERLAPVQRRDMLDGKIRLQLARQRQHERAADQKMRALLGDEHERQAFMPIPTAEEPKGTVRSAAGAKRATEAEDGDAAGTMVARELQQSAPPLRKQIDDVARRSDRHCGSGRDDDSSTQGKALRNRDVCNVQRVTPLPRL